VEPVVGVVDGVVVVMVDEEEALISGLSSTMATDGTCQREVRKLSGTRGVGVSNVSVFDDVPCVCECVCVLVCLCVCVCCLCLDLVVKQVMSKRFLKGRCAGNEWRYELMGDFFTRLR